MAAEGLDRRLQRLLQLPATSRIPEAARLAREARDSPALIPTIEPLVKHAPPVPLELLTDDGLSEIIPPPQRNLAKHFDSHWTALVMAAASRNAQGLALLLEELKSASSTFQNFVARHLIKHGNHPDDFILALLKELTPTKRHVVLLNCIRAHRTAVLDQFVETAKQIGGLKLLAYFVHACSTPVLEAQLANDDVRSCPHIQWKYICRHHSSLVVQFIAKDLEGVAWQQRDKVWHQWNTTLQGWKATTELLYNGRATLPLLRLWRQYPIYNLLWDFQLVTNPDPKIEDFRRTHTGIDEKDISGRFNRYFFYVLPALLENQLQHVVQSCPEECADILCQRIKVLANGKIGGFHNTGFLQRFLTSEKVPHRCKLQVLDHIFSLSTPFTLFYNKVVNTAWDCSWDVYVLNRADDLLRAASPKRRVELMEYVLAKLAAFRSPCVVTDDPVMAREHAQSRPSGKSFFSQLLDAVRGVYSFETRQVIGRYVYQTEYVAQVDTSTDVEDVRERLRLKMTDGRAECVAPEQYHVMWTELVKSMVQSWFGTLVTKLQDLPAAQSLHQLYQQMLPSILYGDNREVHLRMFEKYCDVHQRVAACLSQVKPHGKYPAAAVALSILAAQLWDPCELYDSDILPHLVDQWAAALKGTCPSKVAAIATTNRNVSGQAVLWYGHEMLHGIRNGLVKLHDAVHAVDYHAVAVLNSYYETVRSAFTNAAPTWNEKAKPYTTLPALPYFEQIVRTLHQFMETRPLPVVPASIVNSQSVDGDYSVGEYVWSRGGWDPRTQPSDRLELERLAGTRDSALLIKPVSRNFCDPLAVHTAFPQRVTVVTIVETALTIQVQVSTSVFGGQASHPLAVLPCAVSKVTLDTYIEKFAKNARATATYAIGTMQGILQTAESFFHAAMPTSTEGQVVSAHCYKSLAHYQQFEAGAVQLYATMMDCLVNLCILARPYSDADAIAKVTSLVLQRTASGTRYYNIRPMTDMLNPEASVAFFAHRTRVCEQAIQYLQNTARGSAAIRALKLDGSISALLLQLSTHYDALVTNSAPEKERRWAADLEQLLRITVQHVRVTDVVLASAAAELDAVSQAANFLERLDLPAVADAQVASTEPDATEDRVLSAVVTAFYRAAQRASSHDMATAVWQAAWQDLVERIGARNSHAPTVQHQLAALRELLIAQKHACAEYLATSISDSINGLAAIVRCSAIEFVPGLAAVLFDRLAPLWHAAVEQVMGTSDDKQCTSAELSILRALSSLVSAQVEFGKDYEHPLAHHFNQWELYCKHREPSARQPEAEQLLQAQSADVVALQEKMLATCWRLYAPRLQLLPYLALNDLEAFHRDLFLAIVAHMPSEPFQAAVQLYCTHAADRIQARQPGVIGFLSHLSVRHAQAKGDADFTVRADIQPLIAVVLEGTVTADRVQDVITLLSLGNHVDRPALLRTVSYPQLLEHLAKTEPATLGAVCATALKFDGVRQEVVETQFEEVRQIVSEMLLYVLDEKKALMEQSGRETLLKYLDVANPASRRLLTKLSDSNSPSERLLGLEMLLQATLAANPADLPTHIRRTTAYFVTKLKNEAVDNRQAALAMLLRVAQERLFAGYATRFAMHWSTAAHMSASDAVKVFPNEAAPLEEQNGGGQTTLQNLLTMLSDALEVQDLDLAKVGTQEGATDAMKHPVLSTFWKLSHIALTLGALMGNVEPHGRELISFAFEVQWRVWLFRAGERGAAERFRLDIGDRLASGQVFSELEDHLPHLQQLEDEFVAQILQQHEARITPINPGYMQKEMTAVLSSAYVSLGAHSSRNKLLQDYLQTLTAKVERLDFAAENSTPIEAVRLEYATSDVHDRLRAGSGVYQPLLQADGSAATMGGRAVYCCQQLLFEDFSAINRMSRAFTVRYLYYDSVQGMWCISDMMQSPANMSRVLAFCKSAAQTPVECIGGWSITTRAIHRSHVKTLNALADVRKKATSSAEEQEPLSWDSVSLQVTGVTLPELDQEFDAELSSILAAVATATGLPTDPQVVACILAALRAYQHYQRGCAVSEHTFSRTSNVLFAIWRLILQRSEEYAAWKAQAASAEGQLANLWLEVTSAFIEIGTAVPLSQPTTSKYQDRLSTLVTQEVCNVLPNQPLPLPTNAQPDIQPRLLAPYAELRAGDDEPSRKPYFTQRSALFADILAATVEHLACYDLSIHINRSVLLSTCPQFALVLNALDTFGAFWIYDESLTRFAAMTIEHTRKYAPKDGHGLLALEEPGVEEMVLGNSTFYPVVAIFRRTMNLLTLPKAKVKATKPKEQQRPRWDKVELCQQFVDLMLHSREARVVLLPWLCLHSEYAASRAERQRNRDRCFGYLLDCTRSAVHLRMIQRHITLFRPEWLELCESSEPITGPFFRSRHLGNELKRLDSRAAAVQSISAAAARNQRFSNRVAAAGRGRGGAVRGRGPGRGAGPARPARKPGQQQATPVTGYDPIGAPLRGATVEDGDVQTGTAILRRRPLTLWEEEMAMQKFRELVSSQKRDAEWEAVDETGELKPSAALYDYIDLSDFRLCYSLRHFSVQQCVALGERYLVQARNKDRAMPERVKSVILWTLLPSTDFVDVVNQIEQNSKGLGTNLKEAFLKGVMKNDEALAPLYYLLRPAFLSSQAARIVTFALPVAVPQLGSQKMLQLLRVILTGDRRKALKVTTYKEVIRLLSMEPNLAKLKLIVREWKREQLHRDVRVVILQSMLRFLNNNTLGAALLDCAWEVLIDCATSAVTASQTEVLDVLLSVMPALSDASATQDTSSVWKNATYFADPRILNHLNELPVVQLPGEHRQKFAQRVLLPLCRRVFGLPTETVSTGDEFQFPADRALVNLDDVAFVALCRLREWWQYIPIEELRAQALPIYEAFLADVRPQALCEQNLKLVAAGHGKVGAVARLVAHGLNDSFRPSHEDVQSIVLSTLRRLAEHCLALSRSERTSDELAVEQHATLLRLNTLLTAFQAGTGAIEIQQAALPTLLESARIAESVGLAETALAIRTRSLYACSVEEIEETIVKAAELYASRENARQRTQLSRQWQHAYSSLPAAIQKKVCRRVVVWLDQGVAHASHVPASNVDARLLDSALISLMVGALVSNIEFFEWMPDNFIVLVRAVLRILPVDRRGDRDAAAPQEETEIPALLSSLASALQIFHNYDSLRHHTSYSTTVQQVLEAVHREAELRLRADLQDVVAKAAAGWCLWFVYELEELHGLWGYNQPALLVSLTPATLSYIESCEALVQAPFFSVSKVKKALAKAANSVYNLETSIARKKSRQIFGGSDPTKSALHALVEYCCTTRNNLTHEVLTGLLADANDMLVRSLPGDWARLVDELLQTATDTVLLEFAHRPEQIRFFLTPFVEPTSTVGGLAASVVTVFRAARTNADLLTQTAQTGLRIPQQDAAESRVATAVASLIESAVAAVPDALAARQPNAARLVVDRDNAQQLATVYLVLGMLRTRAGCGIAHWALGTNELRRMLEAFAPLACAEQCVETFASLFCSIADCLERMEPGQQSAVNARSMQSLLSIGMVESADAGVDVSGLWPMPPAVRLPDLPAELDALYVAHYRRAVLEYCLSNQLSRFDDAPQLLSAIFKELQLPLPPSRSTARFDVVFVPASSDGVVSVDLQKRAICQLIASARAEVQRRKVSSSSSSSQSAVETTVAKQIVLERVQEALEGGFYDVPVRTSRVRVCPACHLGEDGNLAVSDPALQYTVSPQYVLMMKLLEAEPTTICRILCGAGHQAFVVNLLKLATLSLSPDTVLRVLTAIRTSSVVDAQADCASILPNFVAWGYDSVLALLPHASKAVTSPPGELLLTLARSSEGVAILLAANALVDERLIRVIAAAAGTRECKLEVVLQQLVKGLEVLHNASAVAKQARQQRGNYQTMQELSAITCATFRTLRQHLLLQGDLRTRRATYEAFLQILGQFPALARDSEHLLPVAMAYASLRATQPFSSLEPPSKLFEQAIEAVVTSPDAAELTSEECKTLAADTASSLLDSLLGRIAETDANDALLQTAIARLVAKLLQRLRGLVVVAEESKAPEEVPMDVAGQEGETKTQAEPSAVVKMVWVPAAQRCLDAVWARMQALAARGHPDAVRSLHLLSLIPLDLATATVRHPQCMSAAGQYGGEYAELVESAQQPAVSAIGRVLLN